MTSFDPLLSIFLPKTCSKCNESFTDSETTMKIEEAAKSKGIWNLGKKTKI